MLRLAVECAEMSMLGFCVMQERLLRLLQQYHSIKWISRP